MSYACRKQNWSTLYPWVTTDVPTMTATANRWGGIQISCHVEESWSTSRRDSTTRWFESTRTSKPSQSKWLGGASVTILSVYIPCNNHLTTRDLSNLIRDIRGQILITGDFNGHNYMWGSHDVDTPGEIIERFTDKHNLCILNDGTHTCLKP